MKTRIQSLFLFIFFTFLSVSAQAQLQVTLPANTTGAPGDTVTLAIHLDNPQANNISAFGLVLLYPQNLLDFLGCDKAGTLTENFVAADCSENTPGRVKFGGFDVEPMNGSGTLVYVSFLVSAESETCADFTVTEFINDFKDVPNSSGSFCVQIPPGVVGTLTPANGVATVGKGHLLTATVLVDGAPQAGVNINFQVTSGPQAGSSGAGTTDAAGHASFDYVGTNTGVDKIQATGAFQEVGFSANAQVKWELARQYLNLNDRVEPVFEFVTFDNQNRFRFDLSLRNVSADTISDSLFVVITSLEPAIVTVVNASNGLTGAGARFRYDQSMGQDGLLNPQKTSAPKHWVFADQQAVDFIFSINVFGFLQDRTATSSDQPPRFFGANVRSHTIDVVTDVAEPGGASLLRDFTLEQNYPNPFNPETRIRYTVPGFQNVNLAIYNLSGQLIRTLVNAVAPAGTHDIIWDGRDGQGSPVASGIYLYKLTAGDFTQVRKLTLLR